MKKTYIKPECNIITLVGPLMQTPGSDIKISITGEIDDIDDANSKSYQGGASSLEWEDDN